MRIPYGKGLQLYAESPSPIQKVLGFLLKPVPRSTMLGSGFYSFLHELQKTQWYTPSELKLYQERHLRALIKHSYTNVPYYHKLFNKLKLSPEDIRTIEDLSKIPILDKDTLRKNFRDLIAVNAASYNYGISSTSGSTGAPVTFYLDQQNREIEYASLWRQRQWAGVNINAKIACYRAFRAFNGMDFQNGKPLWRYNALSKELEFNIFGLNDANIEKQVAKLRQFKPDIIEGYPSVIEIVSRYIINNDILDIKPMAVLTSSETLSTRRKIIEQAFDCRVLDWYAQSEYVVSAGQCPDGTYHSIESGIMEFVKGDDEHVSDGELGEIVGTRLYNYSMPLIRYKTSDLSRYSKDSCKCGRGLAVIQSIEGRISDSIIASDGRIITGPPFEHYWKKTIAPGTPHIDYVHVIQKSDKKIIIQIVKSKRYSKNETVVILNGLAALLGPDIVTEFEELESIPKKKKWRFSESEMNLKLN